MTRGDELKAIQSIYETLTAFEPRQRLTILTSAACLAGCISQQDMASLIRDLLARPVPVPAPSGGST